VATVIEYQNARLILVLISAFRRHVMIRSFT
jgi:hypothetical protein